MQSMITEVRREDDLLMSSRANRTAAMMAAAITSVEAKRSTFWDSLCSYAIARFISPIQDSISEEKANIIFEADG
jgi:hypothetical protein